MPNPYDYVITKKKKKNQKTTTQIKQKKILHVLKLYEQDNTKH